MKITVLAGRGINRHYEYGIIKGLVGNGLKVDFIGPSNDQLNAFGKDVTVYNYFEGYEQEKIIYRKLIKIIMVYLKLFVYTWKCESKIFHIQWLIKFEYFDRVVLNAFYKIFGKRVVLTAHNIDAGERDGISTFINRATLKCMYVIVDHIIVHTNKSKSELNRKFNIRPEKVTVIPHGIMDMVPKGGLTREDSRENLGLPKDKKTILFFGSITKYKGLDVLIEAMGLLSRESDDYHLVVAGSVKTEKEGDQNHYKYILDRIDSNNIEKNITKMIQFVPDDLIEALFMSADVLVLPYRHIFQSGVPFLSYYFGLPVVASDVGSFEEEIQSGKTGYIFKAGDPTSLKEVLKKYFESDLYCDLTTTRKQILEYAENEFSWIKIGLLTKEVLQAEK